MNLLALAAQGAESGGSIVLIVIVSVVVVFGLVLSVFGFTYGSLWLQAYLSKAHVSIVNIVGMRLRQVSPRVIIHARIMATKAGIDLDTDKLEAHYLARGNVPRVVQALIAANKANINLEFERAAAIDLAGRNVLEAVQTSVNPRVIDSPDPTKGRSTIDAVAKDGIQLKAKARVTVRANLDRLVGGATEETIIARVGEGIVSAIGSANTHKEVLENPDHISKVVLAKGLDAGTAYEILSIDIADVDVGENIGAKLQTDQAEADKKVAQARAEVRRAMAVALEQENKAKIHENRALVVLAEAEIPKAMSEAFRQGNMGVMDYLHLRNVQADTGMRDSISGRDRPTESGDPST
ncbi:MAG: flotillin-like protein FloA [Planctomycetota bacterium]|nr:flotillin-like protein FloA [Planctomycetota bacterium]